MPKGIERFAAFVYNIIAKKHQTGKRVYYTTMRNRCQLVLPIELGVKIAQNDPVRKLVEICDTLDYTELYRQYVRTWRKVSPETLFELVVFGYMQRRYSTRQIEEACKTDIRFMWILQGEPAPDHSTIDRFLDKRLANVIEDLFYQLVDRLLDLGEVRFRNMFVDGTKLEANANRYTFVWKKAVEKNLKKLTAKIEAQLPAIAARYGMVSYVTVEDACETLVRHANMLGLKFVHGCGKRKTQLQKDIELLGGYIGKKAEYLEHLGKMQNRNSYSKSDTDATFMRMKDDYMKNGQLKPGYNIQIGVESEYIVACGAYSNCTDVQTLIPFLERFHSHTGRRMEQIIADAGYESSENYLYLEEHGQRAFIKPCSYEICKSRAYKADRYSIEHMLYDAESDCFICENGEFLRFCREEIKTTVNGYETHVRIYRNESCAGCPHFGKCHKSCRGFREIKVNRKFSEHRRQSLDNIVSDEGVLLRINRSIQVEGAFGVLKQDFSFRRFLFRGKRNVEMQFFLLAFAFNIHKLCNRIQNHRVSVDLFSVSVTT